jgi:catechol 2,3-dioxygenase-like lactoylglutathione lyase family enzyme
MKAGPIMAFSHVGICVSDIERSTRFYTEGFGFVVSHSLEAGPPLDTMTELPGLNLKATFLKLDGTVIELLFHVYPAAIGAVERRPMNQLGLTHLSFIVSDLATVTERIARYGGRIYPQTLVKIPAGELMFCTDPDGVRIELWQKVG